MHRHAILQEKLEQHCDHIPMAQPAARLELRRGRLSAASRSSGVRQYNHCAGPVGDLPANAADKNEVAQLLAWMMLPEIAAEAAYAQAMELAVENARSRAEVLAGVGEVELKDVHTISSYIGGGMPFGGGRNMSFDMVESAASVPVSPGEMEIVVDVTVVYEIK